VSEDQNQGTPRNAVSLSDLGGLFNMLDRACGELSGVKNQLQSFTAIPVHLQNLCDGQKRMEQAISDLKADHKDAVRDMSAHKEDIIKLQGTVDTLAKEAGQLEKSVEKLQTDMNGIVVKIAAVAGGVSMAIWLVTQGIAVYDKLPHGSGKVGSIMPPVLTRGRG
jgi:DNA repair ATPase RecN